MCQMSCDGIFHSIFAQMLFWEKTTVDALLLLLNRVELRERWSRMWVRAEEGDRERGGGPGRI